MKGQALLIGLPCAALLTFGCAGPRGSASRFAHGDFSEPVAVPHSDPFRPEARKKLLALDPEQVTELDVRELLSQMPAPRIISIHGGVLPIKHTMNSFARFLIGMGYPESSLRDPADGAFTYGYYDGSDKLAGAIAWYYERDGLRPILVGHSLGGIQAVRVLHKLAGDSGTNLTVWNPLTRHEEERAIITDPLTGHTRPVVGVQVSYACVSVAGGLGRILPNEWDMYKKLRKIPDSVEEFTGFQKGLDVLGGDFMGYGSANDYYATGTATVRNVRLPSVSAHSTIPDTSHLLEDQELTRWIGQYRPEALTSDEPEPEPAVSSKSARVLYAAEVWFGIKKHWVLELQRLIRARYPQDHAG
jgi:hypothetical protein